MDKPMIIGKRVVDFDNVKLERLIREKQMKVFEFADAIGVSCSSVSSWTHGKRNPSIENLIAISDFFGISSAELRTEEKPKKAGKKTSGQSEDVRAYKRAYDLLSGLLIAAVMTMRNSDDPCQFCKYAQENDGSRFCRLGSCNWKWKLSLAVDNVLVDNVLKKLDESFNERR